MLILTDISECLTLQEAFKKGGRHPIENDLSIVQDAAIAIMAGRVIWVGARKDLGTCGLTLRKFAKKKMGGRVLMPGFVESHTHSVFSGSRGNEFEMRLGGKSYLEIAQAGGGIMSTVTKVRQDTEQTLLKKTQGRVNKFLAQGVTTLEIKSGYGLNEQHELRLLKLIKKIKGPKIVATYLGPHSKSPEFSNYDTYFANIVESTLPKLARQKLASRVDIFVDNGFFSIAQAREYFEVAKNLGFDLSIHGEQLSRTGATQLAVEFGARSADHVVEVNSQDIDELAKSQVTAVLLPAADFYLGISYPPARKMIDAGVRVALATDFNPGSSPTQDLAFVGLLARTQMKMSLAEVIVAYTVGAAFALGQSENIGSIEVKKFADFAVLDASWRELFFQVGQMPIAETWVRGKNLKKT